MFRDSDATIICWAMGITQHHNAVATIKEIVNVALLRGNIGKPGAGLCPVRGHSNVQGDRTMGIWERPPAHFLDALRDEFGFDPPREHGLDTVRRHPGAARRQGPGLLRDGRQLRRRPPPTPRSPRPAMRNAALTVHVSTKLNRSHVVHGGEALILPGPGPHRAGPHRRPGPAGHRRGLDVGGARLARPARPAVGAPALRGRHRLLAGAGHPRRRDSPSRGRRSAPTTPRSAAGSPASCPAARRTTRRSTSPAASCCRTRRATTRTFETETGKAVITVSPLEVLDVPGGPAAAADAALARPVQHHDLRPRRPLPRHQGRPPGGVRQPRRLAAPRLRRRRRRRPRQRVARRRRAARAGPSASCPTTSRAAAPPPTTRRPTRSSRSTPPRRRATPRPPSPSSCGWTARADGRGRHGSPTRGPVRGATSRTT